jgi:phosphoglycolate phosphatase-like HAD superfamily hydrolase
MVQAADPLPSWNEGAPKKAIVEFVSKVTKEGAPGFVPPANRIATFDNDGTLWAEQPMYVQLLFALDRVKALAPQHPEWKDKEPFASLLKGDVKGALAGGEPAIYQIVMATHAGMTTDDFEKLVTDWIATAKHPVTQKPYTEMLYQPMLEVLAYLRANGFKTFIASGGGVEFMRPWVEKAYGIPPEQVVGSSGKLKFDLRDGTPTLMKLPELHFFDDKAGKPRRHTNLYWPPSYRCVRQFGWRFADASMDLRGIRHALLSLCASHRCRARMGLRPPGAYRPARQRAR